MNNKETHIELQAQTHVMRDRRHPMRQALTRIEDLFVDIDREVILSDLSEIISQSIGKMAARKSGEPGFWLHAFRFLNDFKDDIYTRLWTGEDEADHQARVVLAQRSAAIQIRLLIRDKHLPPALKSALTHLFGPALAILMLRRDQDRNSRTLLNAMQLVYEVIETYQEPSSFPAPYDRPVILGLRQQLHEFFKGITGIRQALSPQVLLQLQSDGYLFLSSVDSSKDTVFSAGISEHDVKNDSNDVLESAHLSLITSESVATDYIEKPLGASEDQKAAKRTIKAYQIGAQGVCKEVALQPVNELKPASASADSSPPPTDTNNSAAPNNLVASNSSETMRGEHITSDTTVSPSPAEVREVIQVDITEPEPTPEAVDFLPEHTQKKGDETAVSINPAFENLLEHLQRDHRLSWFQIQVEKSSSVRRLMFGNYDCENQSLIFVNVHQRPSLTLSVADFDLGLKNGLTHPLYAEPAINKLFLEYLRLGS